MKTTQKYTEQELVSLLKRQDATAFSCLYDNYASALNGIVHSFVQDEQAAYSILQDSFVKIWKQITSFDEQKGRLFTWMSSVTRNTAIDFLRSKEWKNSCQNVALTDNNNNIAADTVLTDMIGLRKMVHNLRDEYKFLVEMCYFEGFSQSEIAAITGIPLGTVKTRLRNALIELRSWINNK
ncbi:RNA polymerase sigma factor [Niabella soli]|uniref:RNA polymerase sigma factor n=1 Tax=Niabella soli TaxID=446683 RepID=UPI0002D3B90B|nr:sigma-70 family RNA polymerase sigma factor [Niabella soli]